MMDKYKIRILQALESIVQKRGECIETELAELRKEGFRIPKGWRTDPAIARESAGKRIAHDFQRIQLAALQRQGTKPSKSEPLTRVQKAILAALDGKCLTADELEAAMKKNNVCVRSTLFRHLSSLKECGKVCSARGGGYYRPDALPSD